MIIVEGKIKGKARPRFNTKSGRTYTPQDTVSYENWVKICYKQQSDLFLEGPIKAKIIAHFAIPKSYTKGKRLACKHNLTPPCKKPDADNIAKIILDSLNDLAYKDDSQIVDLSVKKLWTEENERVEIELIKCEYEGERNDI